MYKKKNSGIEVPKLKVWILFSLPFRGYKKSAVLLNIAKSFLWKTLRPSNLQEFTFSTTILLLGELKVCNRSDQYNEYSFYYRLNLCQLWNLFEI